MQLHGQIHSWASAISAKGGCSISTMNRDINDNIYIVGNYKDSLIINDTVKLGFNNGSSTSNRFLDAYLAKMNPSGKVEWAKRIYISDIIYSNYDLFLSNISVSRNGIINLYGIAHFDIATNSRSVVKFGENDSINVNDCGQSRAAKFANFLVSFDTLGNVLNYSYIACGGIDPAQSNNSGLLTTDSFGNPILLLNYANSSNQSSTFYEGFKPYNLSTGLQLIKYSKTLDSIIFAKALVNKYTTPSRVHVGEDNLIYTAFNLIRDSIYTINGVSYNLKQNVPPASFNGSNRVSKGFIMITNQNGDIIHQGLINSKLETFDFIADIYGRDTNNIYILGYVKDTLSRNNKTFATNITPSSYIAGNTTLTFPYIAKISLRDIYWAQITNDNQTQFQLSNLATLTFRTKFALDRKGFAYVALDHSLNTLNWGGLADTSSSSGTTKAFVKMDSVGNALWIQRFTSNVTNMKPNGLEELAYCGTSGPRTFAPFTLENNFNRNRSYGFVAQLEDLNIIRGEVSKGPYCAGDTFNVPFTKTGEYDDTANFFIAELSDENGNFEGRERELGRIKTTEDSTINGKLPLFEVASSGNYRIRVRSTHPSVQSFYKLDSLRLLIYSRDKADPGPAETVCFGDSFQLKTFGGTAWQWSPSYNMDDSTSRTPFIIPDKDTVYRIIISDSSGCGEADTAFKQIFIKSNVQVISEPLINACLNSQVNLIANFTGGDSSNYKWQWYNTQNLNNWAKIREDSLKSFDTLIINYPNIPISRRLAIVLTDGCKTALDTAYINVRLTPLPSIPVALSTKDSHSCTNSSVMLTAQFPDIEKYESYWLNAQGDTLRSGSNAIVDSLEVTPVFNQNQPETYRVVTINNCAERRDTASITLSPRETLKVTPSTFDTLVCYETKLSLNAIGSGGVASKYQFQWLATPSSSNGGEWTLLSSEDTLNFIPSTENNSTLSTQHLKLILSDGCTPENDTVEVLINVRPALSAAILQETKEGSRIQDTTVCSGSELQFFAKGFGGDKSNYSYQWEATSNGEEWELLGSDSVATLGFSKNDNINMIRLILNDDCSPADTSFVTINVLPALFVTLMSWKGDTVCSGEEIELIAEPSGGKSSNYQYHWLINDSLVSSDSATKVTLRVPQGDKHVTNQIKLILSDACTSPNDTFEQIIVVRPKLDITLSAVEVCANPSSTLSATPSGGNSASYQIEWLDEDNTQIGLGETLVVTPNKVTSFKVILSDGCSEPNAESQIKIDKLPSILELTPSPIEGCEPLEVEFDVNTNYSNPYTYKLQFTPSDSFRSALPPFTFTYSTGIYNPTLKFISELGCTANINGPEITVHPKPTASFNFTPQEPTILNNKVSFINNSLGAISYEWAIEPFGNYTDFEPVVTFDDSGRYMVVLVAISDQGCRDTAEGKVFVRSAEQMFMPTAFSPNGDGLNEVLEPTIMGFEVLDFAIYNRWGDKIFSSRGAGWDGTYRNQPVQPGTYTYLLSLRNKEGKTKMLTGTVSLVR